MSMSSTDKGLITPENCLLILIDHQPHMFSGVTNIAHSALLNNVVLLAKAARLFGVPVIFSAIRTDAFEGKADSGIKPELLDLFPDQRPIERTSMNAWDSTEFAAAVRRSGKRNVLIAALWSETCLVFPVLQMLEESYGVHVVEDASGSTSATAHAAAIRRIEQAGGVSLTALQVLLELQRDWSHKDHVQEVMVLMKEHVGRTAG